MDSTSFEKDPFRMVCKCHHGKSYHKNVFCSQVVCHKLGRRQKSCFHIQFTWIFFHNDTEFLVFHRMVYMILGGINLGINVSYR